jgi:hypothetical protein
MAYPNLSDVKTYIGIGDSADDARLTLIIAWTQALMEDYLGRELTLTEHTQKSYKIRSQAIQLVNYPVASITSITFDGDTQSVSDFDLSEDIGSVYGDLTTVDELVIVYQGGFTDLPPVIEQVFYQICEDQYDDYKGISKEDIKDVTLFDFAKVSFQQDNSSRQLTYSGVGSSGNIPDQLLDYLGVLDMYKSNNQLVGVDGIN